MFKVSTFVLCCFSVLVSCSAAVDPELTLTPAPRTIANTGATSVITVTATDSKGKPGIGNVRVTSAAGSLRDGTVVRLVDGTVDVDFTCDVASDSACVRGSVRLTGEWVNNGALVEALSSVSLTTTGGGQGGGSATGGGGGSGGGGATDGGTGGGVGSCGSFADAGSAVAYVTVNGTAAAIGTVAITALAGNNFAIRDNDHGFLLGFDNTVPMNQIVGDGGVSAMVVSLYAEADGGSLNKALARVPTGGAVGPWCDVNHSKGCVSAFELKMQTPTGVVTCHDGGVGLVQFLPSTVGFAGSYSYACADQSIKTTGCFRYVP